MSLARQFGASPAEMEIPKAVCETHPIFVQIPSPVFELDFRTCMGHMQVESNANPLFFSLFRRCGC